MQILLSFWLLFLQQILSLNPNTSRKGIKQIHGQWLINSRFDTHFGISLDDCTQKCKDIRTCKSINYIRKSGFCELNYAEQTTNPGALQTRAGAIFSAKCDWDFEEPEQCNSCSDREFCLSDKDKSCQIFGCLPPVPVAGAKILGNLFNVGAKRLYKCSTGLQQASVCQDDRTWSPVTLTCTCGDLEIGNANYTTTETDSGVTEATISCDYGYVHVGIKTVQCNQSTWEWDKLEQVRCENILVAPWTLVYRTTHGTDMGNLAVYTAWNKKRKHNKYFRNDEIVDNWSNMKIKRVKVDILNFSGKVAATLVFDGTGTDKKNWFSRDKLIYSTWGDLKADLSVTVFSITGLLWKSSNGKAYFLRWSILNAERNPNDVMAVDCSRTTVWLAIMKSINYPCDDVQRTNKTFLIVFSDSENGTTWTSGKLKEAREFKVSVLLT